MKRTISDFLIFLGILSLLALYWASGWLAAPAGHGFISGMWAALALAGGALLVYFTSDRALNQLNPVAPVAYLILASAHPAALFATPLHAAAVLLAASLYCLLSYCSFHPSLANLSGMGISLGAASLFFPPLLWLAPVYGLLAVGRAADKAKFAVTAILSLILPIAAYAGIRLLLGNGLSADEIPDFWQRMTALTRPSLAMPASTLCRILLTVAATAMAFIQLFRRMDRYRTAPYRAALRLLFLTLAIGLLVLLFLSDGSQPAGLVMALPVSMLLGDCFGQPEHRVKGLTTLIIILLVILVAERIACFV